ncbi:MAG: hypothetical protein R6V31_07680 [Halohasta sp.]
MNRFYIFYACLAIFGAVFTFSAATTIIHGDSSVPIIFEGIGGIVVLGSSVYTVLTGSPSEFDIGDVAFWAVVVGTAGILLGQVIQFV